MYNPTICVGIALMHLVICSPPRERCTLSSKTQTALEWRDGIVYYVVTLGS